MQYEKHYNSLIEKRIKNPATGYTENHHILPKSMGGSDESSNLVRLTGREHWVAHLLLHKIHRLPQTAHACHMMAMRCEERGISQIRNSRMYEAIRIECIKLVSKKMKKYKGKRNSQYGTMWICNLELKENRKIKKEEQIPEGWVKGRNKWNKKISNKYEENFLKQKERVKKIYTSFIESKMTLREYANNHYDFSYVSLHKLFKKYVDGYTLTQGKRKTA